VKHPLGGRNRRAGRLRLLVVIALLVIAAALAFGTGETSERAQESSSAALGRPASDGPAKRSGESPAGAVALDEPDSLRIDLAAPPRAGLLFDLDSGEVLWRRDPRAVLPIASLTKVMTALLVVDRARPDKRVRITREAIDFSGSAVGLPKGKRAPVESLLNAVLVQSGNDAAQALAIGVAGSERRFVKLMNKRAERLGLDCTRFVSPDGLEPGNRSCAADLAALARLAMEEPRIARIAGREQAVVPFPIDGGRLHLATTNPLLSTDYAGTIGLKTGYTVRAGQCLIGVVRRKGRTLAAVVIDSSDSNRDARALFDRAFRAGSSD